MKSDLNTTFASSVNDIFFNFTNKLIIPLYKEFPSLGYSLFGITYAQYILAALTFIFILIIRPILIAIIVKILKRAVKKTQTNVDDIILRAIIKPLRFTFLLIGLYLLIYILTITSNIVYNILNSLAIFNLFWYIYSITNSLKNELKKIISKVNKELSKELSNFILRLVNIVIYAIGISAILSIWGINVTAIIASLGIGGLAFALAAKDTAANLFGSIAILADKSIKTGDWINVNGVEGIVEDIGMRTTKIRTFQKSITAIPNSIIANSPIENFSRRDIRRINFKIGLLYSTKNENLKNIVFEIKQMLLKHPGVASKETILVNFDSFGDSALEIFIYFYANTAIWQKYLEIKEDINYKIIDIVKRNNSDFAFPSNSVYIEKFSNNNLT